MYRRPGLLTITWGNLEIPVGKSTGLCHSVGKVSENIGCHNFEAIQYNFIYFFWSVQLILIYFVVGYSSRRSTTNLILWKNKHFKVFMHEIFNQPVSHVNGKHPRRVVLCTGVRDGIRGIG